MRRLLRSLRIFHWTPRHEHLWTLDRSSPPACVICGRTRTVDMMTTDSASAAFLRIAAAAEHAGQATRELHAVTDELTSAAQKRRGGDMIHLLVVALVVGVLVARLFAVTRHH